MNKNKISKISTTSIITIGILMAGISAVSAYEHPSMSDDLLLNSNEILILEDFTDPVNEKGKQDYSIIIDKIVNMAGYTPMIDYTDTKNMFENSEASSMVKVDPIVEEGGKIIENKYLDEISGDSKKYSPDEKEATKYYDSQLKSFESDKSKIITDTQKDYKSIQKKLSNNLQKEVDTLIENSKKSNDEGSFFDAISGVYNLIANKISMFLN